MTTMTNTLDSSPNKPITTSRQRMIKYEKYTVHTYPLIVGPMHIQVHISSAHVHFLERIELLEL